MSAHLISLFLFVHSIVFGSIAVSSQRAQISHHIKENINNASDGLLIGLILFEFFPHLLEHWLGDGHSIILLAGLLILPAALALLCGNAMKKATSHIALITFSVFLFHSFIEGSALGSSFARPEFIIVLFSLVIHKSVESFCFVNQIIQLFDSRTLTLSFLITHALSVLLGFEFGLQLPTYLHKMHDIELYLDSMTVLSLIFLVFFCNSTRHNKKCSHGWNRYSWLGLLSCAVFLLAV